MVLRPPRSTLFPYTTPLPISSMLLKTLISLQTAQTGLDMQHVLAINVPVMKYDKTPQQVVDFYKDSIRHRSEEHTSELQSLTNLVCRLLLEKKKKNKHK